MGAKLKRTLHGIAAAQSIVGEMAAKFSLAVTAAGPIQQRLGTLQEQAAKAGVAINRIGGQKPLKSCAVRLAFAGRARNA